MKQDEKKLEDKEKEENGLMDELEQLKQEVEDSTNLSADEKAQLDRLIKIIGTKATRQSNFLARLGAFILALLFNFIAFYLAYGVIYKYVIVTRLNALYLILGISAFKAICRMVTISIKNSAVRFKAIIIVYMVLILGTYLVSNLKILYSFNSIMDIIIFYLIAEALFELLSITYTKIKLERMMR